MPVRPVICTMLNAPWATFNGKNPRLEELCFACGVDYDPALAHAAAFDVDVMMQCYWRGLKFGFYQEPELPAIALAA
jgi:DNA polymerase-3 subunit epsilon